MGTKGSSSSWPDWTLMANLEMDRAVPMERLSLRGPPRLVQGQLARQGGGPGAGVGEDIVGPPAAHGWPPGAWLPACRELWGQAWAGTLVLRVTPGHLALVPLFLLKTLPNLSFLPRVSLHLPQGASALRGLLTPPTSSSAPLLSRGWSELQIKPGTPSCPPGGNKN